MLGLGESLLRLSAPGPRAARATPQQLDVHVGRRGDERADRRRRRSACARRGSRGSPTTRSGAASPRTPRRTASSAGRRLGPGRAGAAVLRRARRGVPRPSEVLYDRDAHGDARAHGRHVRLGRAAGRSTRRRCRAGSPARSATARPAAVRALFAAARDAGVADRRSTSTTAAASGAGRRPRRSCARCSRASTSCSRAATTSSGCSTATTTPVALARRAIDAFGHTLVVLRDSAATVPGAGRGHGDGGHRRRGAPSAAYEAEVVDAFGAGDAALGALLAALLSGEDVATAVDQAAWASRSSTPRRATRGRAARPTSRSATDGAAGAAVSRAAGETRRARAAARQRRRGDHAAARPPAQRRDRPCARRRRAHRHGGHARRPGRAGRAAGARRRAARSTCCSEPAPCAGPSRSPRRPTRAPASASARTATRRSSRRRSRRGSSPSRAPAPRPRSRARSTRARAWSSSSRPGRSASAT